MGKRITTTQITALNSKEAVVSESLNNGGSLQARRLSEGVAWRYRYRHKGKLLVYVFGTFSRVGDSTGSEDAATYTLVGARRRAETLAALQAEVGNLVEHFEARRRQAEIERKRKQAAFEAAERDSTTYSLQRLCESYWQHLEKQGKRSARDVRNSLTRWVIDKHPDLAATRASDVSTQDVMRILKTIVQAGKTTTTNRVRSNLAAAYAYGMGSALNLLADSNNTDSNLTANPVTAIPPVGQFEQAGNRTLTPDELGEFVRRLSAIDKPAAKTAQLALHLGAQRIQQVLAATVNDYDAAEQTLTLFDSKGRRTHPRAHLLPVPATARALLEAGLAHTHPRRQGLYGGLNKQTVSNLVRGIGKDMAVENKAEPFTWRDCRRTAETMLAAMGISKDLRAQIQSHGITGVQAKHYDRHDYLSEKRAALERWCNRLDDLAAGRPAASNVIALDVVSQ